MHCNIIDQWTHIRIEWAYLGDNGHLLPPILLDDSCDCVKAGVVGGDGSEEIGESFSVWESDGRGSVADLWKYEY